MKIMITTILICFSALVVSAQQKAKPQFNDFKVSVYKGKIQNPKWAKRVSSNEWKDDLGNAFERPQVNFGGKYLITLHYFGGGRSAAYYELNDLSTGKELNILGAFGWGDPVPKTPDGFEYKSNLYFEKNSKLIIAQFLLEKDGVEKGCRERAFIFDGKKLVPVGKGKMVPLTKNYTECRELR
jgi:hypothetical protein